MEAERRLAYDILLRELLEVGFFFVIDFEKRKRHQKFGGELVRLRFYVVVDIEPAAGMAEKQMPDLMRDRKSFSHPRSVGVETDRGAPIDHDEEPVHGTKRKTQHFQIVLRFHVSDDFVERDGNFLDLRIFQ